VRAHPGNEQALREQVLVTAQRLVSENLTRGTSGNVSARLEDDAFLVTPSGVPYDRLQPADVVRVEMDGTLHLDQRPPSSEWRIHRDLLVARPDIAAVVHAHPPFATTLACLRQSIPAVHYEIAFAGGHDVRCAAYATYGTQELSEAALVAMVDRNACLLANHGILAVGPSLDLAFRVARVVETVAELHWRALAIGVPVLLDREEMDRVVAKFADYGKG
jgi:L-fuculose-phosphate aldolase